MIGIDVGSKYIKLCQVEKEGSAHRVIAALLSPNPLSQNLEIADADALLAARIKKMLHESRLTAKQAASSIGGSQSTLRYLSFPQLPDEELRGAVKFEAEQSISSDLSAMCTDFQRMPQTEKDKVDILFVAVPTQVVDANMDILKRAGLQTEVMDIDNLALTNCYLAFEPKAEEETVVLLDIGHSYTNISIVDDGELRFVRNLNAGGANVSEEIANSFGVPFDVAEEIKKQPEKWNEIGLNMKSVLRRSMPDLLEAVYRSIEYCMSRNTILNIDRILLTGGSSYLSGLDSFLGEVLDIRAVTWNPLASIDLKPNNRPELGRFFSVALGLALRQATHV